MVAPFITCPVGQLAVFDVPPPPPESVPTVVSGPSVPSERTGRHRRPTASSSRPPRYRSPVSTRPAPQSRLNAIPPDPPYTGRSWAGRSVDGTSAATFSGATVVTVEEVEALVCKP